MVTENPCALAPPDGEQLVARVRAGDMAAEEQLVSAYRRGVFLIAMARTRDREAAQDLTQEVLIAVLQALRAGQLREPDKLAAFIQGITRNMVNNHFRNLARHRESDLAEAEATAAGNAFEDLEQAERRQLLRRELDSVSALDRQILLLSLVDGHSLAEVARRLEMSHEAVRARKSRLVKKIVEKLRPMSHR